MQRGGRRQRGEGVDWDQEALSWGGLMMRKSEKRAHRTFTKVDGLRLGNCWVCFPNKTILYSSS